MTYRDNAWFERERALNEEIAELRTQLEHAVNAQRDLEKERRVRWAWPREGTMAFAWASAFMAFGGCCLGFFTAMIGVGLLPPTKTCLKEHAPTVLSEEKHPGEPR